jgi:hypothetical protein
VSENANLDPHAAARKRRNIILGLALMGFVALIYVITIAQIRGGIAAP